jgi:hypothetical protein
MQDCARNRVLKKVYVEYLGAISWIIEIEIHLRTWKGLLSVQVFWPLTEEGTTELSVNHGLASAP